MNAVWSKWLDLLFRPPPSPPDELVAGVRDLRRAAVTVRREARRQRAMIDRANDVVALVRDRWAP